MHSFLTADWQPVGVGPDGEPLGYMRNESVFGPQGANPSIFDGPDGEHIGYLVPLAGIVPKDLYEAPDFDAHAYAEELRPGVHAEVEAERREVLESLEDQGILDPAALGGA